MTVVKKMLNQYTWLMSLNDKRVADWPGMVSPLSTLAIIVLYVAISIYGPRILKGKVYPVKKFIVAFNALSIALNLFIAYELWSNTIGYYYFPCEPVDYSVTDRNMRIASAIWWSYFSKIFELLDTMFFMLRGKYGHMSFLHIYHHSSMIGLMWIAANNVPGGNSVFGPALNACLHVLVYSYYLVSSLGPQYKKYLGWKQSLTALQIAQFCINLLFCINALFMNDCKFPLWMICFGIYYMSSYIVLFGNFYIKNYMKSRPQHEKIN